MTTPVPRAAAAAAAAGTLEERGALSGKPHRAAVCSERGKPAEIPATLQAIITTIQAFGMGPRRTPSPLCTLPTGIWGIIQSGLDERSQAALDIATRRTSTPEELRIAHASEPRANAVAMEILQEAILRAIATKQPFKFPRSLIGKEAVVDPRRVTALDLSPFFRPSLEIGRTSIPDDAELVLKHFLNLRELIINGLGAKENLLIALKDTPLEKLTLRLDDYSPVIKLGLLPLTLQELHISGVSRLSLEGNLSRLNNLKTLTLYFPNAHKTLTLRIFPDAHIAQLETLPVSLTDLRLVSSFYGYFMTPRHFRPLQRLIHLERFSIDTTGGSGSVESRDLLEHLPKTLREFSCSLRVSDVETTTRNFSRFTRLEKLTLISGRNIPTLAILPKTVTDLRLFDCGQGIADSLEVLRQFPRLLYLSLTRLSATPTEDILRQLPSAIRELDVTDSVTSSLTIDHFKRFTNLTVLKGVDISEIRRKDPRMMSREDIPDNIKLIFNPEAFRGK